MQNKKLKIVITFVLLAVVVLAAAFFYIRSQPKPQSTAKAFMGYITTGNYVNAHDLGTATFQKVNSVDKLTQTFSPLKKTDTTYTVTSTQKSNVGPIVVGQLSGDGSTRYGVAIRLSKVSGKWCVDAVDVR